MEVSEEAFEIFLDEDEVEQDVTEEVIMEAQENEEHVEEEYLVGEEIIPSSEINVISNSLDHIAAENLIYMAQDNNVSMGDLIEEQVEQAENADYNEQQYFECQVTEEVITDDWVQPQGEERVEIPVDQLTIHTDEQIEEVDVPLPTDQDEYTTSRPYPCDFCSRRFRKKANLMNHMVAHQNDRPHVCNLCGARYIRKCDLINHLKIHAYVPDQDLDDTNEKEQTIVTNKRNIHQTQSSYQQKKRTKNLSSGKKIKLEQYGETKFNYVDEDMKLLSEAAQEHENYVQMREEQYPVVDPKKPFVCQHCGVGFAREKALASHSRMHAGDSPFECESCSEMFWDVTLLQEHQKTHHSGYTSNSEFEPENEEDTDSESNSKYGEFYCDLCGMSFHRQDLLKRHSKIHVKKEMYEGHCCNVCGEAFAEALDLLAHAEVHARVVPLKCLLCGETFLEETSIKTHIGEMHSNELQANSCRLCGKLCRDGRALMKHAWDHSREKNHSCSKCGKTFHNKARLKRHMLSHRNKTVSCDICGEEFPDGRSLMNHRHSHTNVSGRQFPCRECGKTFGSRSSQQIHIRIHTGERPYGCKYCWKAFADGGTLRKHERIHTGEKPYACPVCPRAFNQRVVLREHIRSHHSGPDAKRGNIMSPYHCTVCSQQFSTSLDLIQHLIQHSDLNTAMKRQPPSGPRKYKRRRKLKPHELERLRAERENANDLGFSDDEELSGNDGDFNESIVKNKTTSPVKANNNTNTRSSTSKKNISANVKLNLNEDYDSFLDNLDETSPQKHEKSISPPPKPAPRATTRKRVIKQEVHMQQQPTRPKMIHTQKTKVAVEDGRKKTKTLVTRIQSKDIPDSTTSTTTRHGGLERNRPRTKNVNYHVLTPEKLPNATFPADGNNFNELFNIKVEKDNANAINSLLNAERILQGLPKKSIDKYSSDIVHDLEEILKPVQQTSPQSSIDQYPNNRKNINNNNNNNVVENNTKSPPVGRRRTKRNIPLKTIPVTSANTSRISTRQTRNTRGEHMSGSSGGHNSVNIKMEKSIKKEKSEAAADQDDQSLYFYIKQEKQEEEIIENYKCEMCSAIFSERAQLLVHVPIHI